MKHYFLLLLALVFVSCAPPYSADLNSSAKLAGQMTLLGTIGPVGSPNGDSTTAIKFLPMKPTASTTTLDQLTPVSGFLVSESSGQESLSFASQDSSGNVQTSNNGGGFSLTGADPNYPLYEYDVLASTATQASIIVYLLNGASTGTNTYQTFIASLPSGPLTGNSTFLLDTLFGGTPPVVFGGAPPWPVIAGQVLPTSAGVDKLNFLFSVSGANEEGYGSFTSPSFTGSTVTNSAAPSLPGAGNRVLYYQGPLGAPSYASYLTGGKWVCQQWTITAGSLKQLTGVTNRIDAVLTDGDLVSTQGGTLTVYDLNGTELNSVSLEGMQFCYEAYVGSTPYVFFSLAMGFSHQAWAFRVYAVPTTALRGLKG